ncbi:MAG: transcriptional regulator [Planctomyces sp.]|nr:transcriptional regulator [Planctomyces sp.]
MLSMLVHDELCVSEIADALGDNLSAVSQRLKLLKSERIVAARRDGKHIYYKLSDHHVKDLVTNALAHVSEPHDHH